MRVRMHPHIVDLAGSGLVLIGLLLAAMAFSAVPVLVQELSRRPTQPQPGAVSGPHAPSGA